MLSISFLSWHIRQSQLTWMSGRQRIKQPRDYASHHWKKEQFFNEGNNGAWPWGRARGKTSFQKEERIQKSNTSTLYTVMSEGSIAESSSSSYISCCRRGQRRTFCHSRRRNWHSTLPVMVGGIFKLDSREMEVVAWGSNLVINRRTSKRLGQL